MGRTPEKILVVGPAWVGDMVMAQSAFRVLRERFPGAAIDVLAPPWSGPLLARMPEVRHALEMPLGHGQFGLRRRWSIGRGLVAQSYGRAIVMPRSLKSALVPWIAGVPVRTGFRGELRYGLLNDLRNLDRARLDQTVKRFVSLALPPGEPLPEPLPLPRLRVDPANRDRLLRELDLRAGAIALMPGAAYGPAKCWPLEHFGSLARDLARDGTGVWILGAASDRPAGELIRAHGGDTVQNLCGLTGLADAVDLLSAASAAVTNDSGLMHVAAAAGTHVVAIYGSSSPAFTPPLTPDRSIHYLGLDCSPCFQRDCPLGHLRCLRDIRPAQVAAALRQRLAQA
jgi:heptosyltransferase-2